MNLSEKKESFKLHLSGELEMKALQHAKIYVDGDTVLIQWRESETLLCFGKTGRTHFLFGDKYVIHDEEGVLVFKLSRKHAIDFANAILWIVEERGIKDFRAPDFFKELGVE